MSERLLVVADQLPFPPRNGVTLPLVNWLQHLRLDLDVRFVLLRAEDQPVDEAARKLHETELGPLTEATFIRDGRLRRVRSELFGLSMYQHGWRVHRTDALAALDEAWCRAPVLVSPISALAKWRVLRAVMPKLQPAVTIAAVHDCTTAEYRWRYRSPQPGLWGSLKAWSHRFRAPCIALAEARLLADADRVLVQTQADLQALRTLVGEGTAARARVAPNGVRRSLLAIGEQPLNRPVTVLFVAELSGEYGATLQWLCQRVWPLLLARVPEARLQVVGRGAPPALLACLAGAPSVFHQHYAGDIDALYAQSAVVWSPLWKGFGLINKTLEGMAAARPVVGGLAAFNGIDGFVSGRHGLGLPAADAQAMAEVTAALLLDPRRAQALGLAARDLVQNVFRWEFAAEQIRAALLEPVGAMSCAGSALP